MDRKSRQKRDRKEQIKKSKQNEDIQFTDHAVAYIDLLRQRILFDEVDDLLKNGADNIEVMNKLAVGVRRVKGFRDAFNNFLRSYTKHNLEKYKYLTGEQRSLMQRMLRTDIKKQEFSDTIIFYSSLYESDELIPITGVKALFVALSGALTLFFSIGEIFRGGVDAGLGSSNCFEKEELFGPAIYHAYKLENEKAQYPRIVIGNELIHYILEECKVIGDDILSKYRRDTAESCRKMTCKDVDGVSILDWLGDVVKSQIGNEGISILEKPVKEGLAFIEKEYIKFRDSGDMKLANRYFMLRYYFQDRQKKFWL